MKIMFLFCLGLIATGLKGQNDKPRVHITATDITCAGKTDGRLDLVLLAGALPVDFGWVHLESGAQGTGQLAVANQPVSLPALAAGAYQFHFTASNGADTLVLASIIEPAPLSGVLTLLAPSPGYHLSCAESRDGVATMNAAGGTGTLHIAWSNGDSGLLADSLDAGPVSVTVTDANACIWITDTILTAPPAISPMLTAVGEPCFGLNTGFIRVDTVAGGIPPYRFSFDGGIPGIQRQWSNLAPGTYFLTIEDAAGCVRQEGVVLPVGPEFTVNLDVDTILLSGDTLRLLFPTGQPVDTLLWSPHQGVQTLSSGETLLFPVLSTTYRVIAINPGGCRAEGEVRIGVSRRRDVYAPNVLAPEAQQMENRSFTLFGGPGIRHIALLQVYDRVGRLWFENRNFPVNDPASGWYGTNGTETAPPAVYLWQAVLHYTDGREVRLQGDVTVIR